MKREIRKVIEDLGWNANSDTSISTTTDVCDREIYIECNNKGELKETIENYCEGYDLDDTVEMYLEAKRNGLSGVPDVTTLVEDCESEQQKLEELWEAVMDLPKF